MRSFVVENLYGNGGPPRIFTAVNRGDLRRTLQRFALDEFGVPWDESELASLVTGLWRRVPCVTVAGEMIFTPYEVPVRIVREQVS